MTRKTLSKLKREWAQLYRSPRKARVLESLAQRLGRKLVNRGKEPMWDNVHFPELPVLSIPHHGGRDLSPRVQRSILDQLEDDLLAWEDKLDDDESGDDEDENGKSGEDNGGR